MKTGHKVCIGIVNDGSLNSQLVVDLIGIVRAPNSRFDSLVQVANIGTTTKSRNVVVLNYLKMSSAEWLLLVDSDEQLPLDAFNKLCDTAHDKERKVVSGLVFAQFGDDVMGLRPIPTLYREFPGEGLVAWDDYPEDSVVKIDAAGTGCLLIHRSVIELMQENAVPNQGHAWAWFLEAAINGIYWGEDILFSKRLKSLGVQMYAHTGAILKHQKKFWLDQRQHEQFREHAIAQALAAQSPEPTPPSVEGTLG